MSYCNNCGVEVDSSVINCPLCSNIIEGREESDSDIQDYPQEPVEEKRQNQISSKRKRFLAWEITSVALAIPFLIVMFTDVIIAKNFNLVWAKFPMAALFLTWALTTFPLLLTKRPIIIVIGEVFSLMLFLTIIDYIDNWSFDWLYRLALPIIGVITIIVSTVVIISIKLKKKGLNIAAIVLFGIAAINVGLDFTIMSYLRDKITLVWSFYVAIPLILLGGFLLYLHFRIAREVDLKKVSGITKRLKI